MMLKNNQINQAINIWFQAAELGKPPERTSKFYVKGALQYLVPLLLQTLTKQVSENRIG